MIILHLLGLLLGLIGLICIIYIAIASRTHDKDKKGKDIKDKIDDHLLKP